jgi:hypothetical protein
MRRAALATLCFALAACRDPVSPDGAPSAPTPSPPTPTPPASSPPDASSPDAADEPTSTQTDTGPSLTKASPLAPKLADIVRALRAKKGVFKLKDELAKSIPAFATEDVKALPDEASVDLVEVRNGFLAMAFVRITGKEPIEDHGPCEPSTSGNTRLLYASSEAGRARLRLAGEYLWGEPGLDVEFFDGTRPRAVVPPIAATVPVVEVHYNYESRCATSYTRGSGKKVELFHVGKGDRIGDPIALDTHGSVPGQSRDESAAITWLAAKKPGTALLAITQVTTDTTWPCTWHIEGTPLPDPSECRTQYSCRRSTQLFVVNADSIEEQSVESLRWLEPDLAKLPPDRSDDSEACLRLTPR